MKNKSKSNTKSKSKSNRKNNQNNSKDKPSLVEKMINRDKLFEEKIKKRKGNFNERDEKIIHSYFRYAFFICM